MERSLSSTLMMLLQLTPSSLASHTPTAAADKKMATHTIMLSHEIFSFHAIFEVNFSIHFINKFRTKTAAIQQAAARDAHPYMCLFLF